MLEIETGYNRPDLTSVYGIAREVSALLDVELAPPPGRDPERVGDESVDIRIDDLQRCPRYIGRLFRDVTVGESPPWLKARLLGAGMRPISNVVDVTNYVMLAFGSPLHAFDHATLAEGRIVVRRAAPGERIRTLDGTERELTTEELVIADAERPIAVAGIMGGEETEVSAATTSVLLEAANFEQLGVLLSGERLRVRPEAQTRWEKGVAPELAEPAALYATQLLVELCGAQWVGEADVKAPFPERPVVRLRPELAEQVVGIPIAADEQRAPPRTPRLRGRGRLDRPGAGVARPRRPARDRPRRGGRALPARGGAARRCRSARRCSAGSRTSSDCAGRSPTSSSAAASSRRTRTRCSRPTRIRAP